MSIRDEIEQDFREIAEEEFNAAEESNLKNALAIAQSQGNRAAEKRIRARLCEARWQEEMRRFKGEVA